MKIAPCWIITFLLVALQWAGAINVHWIWLIAPLWIPLVLLVICFAFLVYAVGKEMKEATLKERSEYVAGMILSQIQQNKKKK